MENQASTIKRFIEQNKGTRDPRVAIEPDSVCFDSRHLHSPTQRDPQPHILHDCTFTITLRTQLITCFISPNFANGALF
jgi:hypothetical protein